MLSRKGIRRQSLLTLAIANTCLIWLSAVHAGDVPTDVFGRLPAIEDLALSPDGTRLAFVKTLGEERQVVVLNLADNKALSGVNVGRSKLRSVRWADNDHLLLVSTVTGTPGGMMGGRSELARLSIYNLRTQKVRDGLGGNVRDLTVNALSGEPMIRRDDKDVYLVVPGLYVTGNVSGRAMSALFKVGLSSGQQLLQTGDEGHYDWAVDAKGRVIAEARYRNSNRNWIIRTQLEAGLTDIGGNESIDIPSIVALSPSGSSLWLRINADGQQRWATLSLKDGTWGEIPESIRGFESVIVGRYDDHVIGAIWVADRPEVRFFDALVQKYWEAASSVVPGRRATLVSYSDDFKRWVILVEEPRTGPVYLLVDVETGKASRLGAAYSGLPELGEVQAITYAAGDGRRIPGFLTLPRGRPPKDLPLVVFPHGGPALRDEGTFDWWAQAMAAQGYAVLQPNFRGSTLSEEHMEAGYGEWGRRMQSDLTDGVNHLAESGVVDRKRVCIVGASYGGYAALSGVALTSGIFRCAVSVAGISDLRSFMDYIASRKGQQDSREGRYLERFLGSSGREDPLLDELSPAKQAKKVSAPILLIHGQDDIVVPFAQSQSMARALESADKSVRLVTLKQEDHWLSRSDTRLQMLQATVDFLKANNPPD